MLLCKTLTTIAHCLSHLVILHMLNTFQTPKSENLPQGMKSIQNQKTCIKYAITCLYLEICMIRKRKNQIFPIPKTDIFLLLDNVLKFINIKHNYSINITNKKRDMKKISPIELFCLTLSFSTLHLYSIDLYLQHFLK